VKELLAPLVAFFLAPSLLQASHLPIKTPPQPTAWPGSLLRPQRRRRSQIPPSRQDPLLARGEHPAKAKAGGNYPKVK